MFRRLAMPATLAAAALFCSFAFAQAPAPGSAGTPAAGATTAPATPPAAAAPGTEPAPAATPGNPPPAPATPQAQSGDPFGKDVTLTAKTVVIMKGTATWDQAFETLKTAFAQLNGFIDKQGLKAAGPVMAVYMSPDDTGFQYQAEIPIAEAPKTPPKGDITVGSSPTGKALQFVHRGSYDAMETTYEAITNYLDEKNLDAGDMYVEEYVTDPLKTAEDQLVVNIYIPVK